MRNHLSGDIDVAVTQLWPDSWLACSDACKLRWARQWLDAHLRDALRLRKPLLIGGFGAMRPARWACKQRVHACLCWWPLPLAIRACAAAALCSMRAGGEKVTCIRPLPSASY